MGMKNFFKKLLGSNTGVSSRRFIALLMIPPYIIGILVGIVMTTSTKNINFLIVSMISAAIPIFIAYYSLGWEHVKEITSGFFKWKYEKNTTDTDV